MHRLTNTLPAILLATVALVCAPVAAQQNTRPWPTEGWTTSSPKEQGMSSERLARMVEFGAKRGSEV